jgi:hypothetical protein
MVEAKFAITLILLVFLYQEVDYWRDEVKEAKYKRPVRRPTADPRPV